VTAVEDVALSRVDATTVVIACAGPEQELTRRVAASLALGAQDVVVDLGEAEMVDSSTLSALKQLAGVLRSRGGSLSVVCQHPGLANLLEMTLLNRSFHVFLELDAALEATSS
jgi:anti-anti-sigma factor